MKENKMFKNITHIVKLMKRFAKVKWHNYKNKRYWTKYYRKHREMTTPSPFAEYCFNKYFSNSTDKSLLELGSGNGRDAIFFAKNGINVLGLDIVDDEIRYLNKRKVYNNLFFKCADFSEYINKDNYDYIYSRFTIHAISEEQETSTLENSYKNLKEGGLIFIEARSVKDDMFAKSSKLSDTEGETDHYRRFLIYENFLEKVKSTGFEIVESIEAQGLAKHNDEDPFIVRVVAKK